MRTYSETAEMADFTDQDTKQLLTRILDMAKDMGFEEIWLGTEDDNIPARALYKSAGGEEESFVMYSWEFEQEDEDT